MVFHYFSLLVFIIIIISSIIITTSLYGSCIYVFGTANACMGFHYRGVQWQGGAVDSVSIIQSTSI